MKSRTLSDSDKKDVHQHVASQYGVTVIEEASQLRLIEGDRDVLTVDGVPAFFYAGEDIVPLISYMLQTEVFGKTIAIDMGAVKPIASGADCMVPGITTVDSTVEKGDIVVVVDEEHGKPLNVARSHMSAEDIRTSEKGRAVETLHHLGDDLWTRFTPSQ